MVKNYDLTTKITFHVKNINQNMYNENQILIV